MNARYHREARIRGIAQAASLASAEADRLVASGHPPETVATDLLRSMFARPRLRMETVIAVLLACGDRPGMTEDERASLIIGFALSARLTFDELASLVLSDRSPAEAAAAIIEGKAIRQALAYFEAGGLPH